MSDRRGLPFRWWRTPGFWAALFGMLMLVMLLFVLAAWFLEVQ